MKIEYVYNLQINISMTKIGLIIRGWTNWMLDKISDIKYKKEFDERYKICEHCENNMFGICKDCGCVIKAKTKAEDSECPKGKWHKINYEV